MKRLFLLRHALTHPSDVQGDAARKLTVKGEEDARAMGLEMQERGFFPEFIVCSPATRTRQTLDCVLESFAKIPIEYVPIIYTGGVGDILKMLRGMDDKYAAILMVGHNPAIHHLAASLADDNSPLAGRLVAGYAPCTLTVLDVPGAAWADVQEGENWVVDLIGS